MRGSVSPAMSSESLTLRQATEDRLSYVRTLLDRNDLPTQDVEAKSDSLYVAFVADEPVGVGGIESHGTDGLLRSVVVERDVRDDGVGTALCDALEERATSDRVERLYLLTTTASDFFDDRGYVEVERAEVPATIRQTTEFDELCPSTATVMWKAL